MVYFVGLKAPFMAGQIQRIQSLYLLFVALLSVLTFFFGLYEASAASVSVEVETTSTLIEPVESENQSTTHFGLLVLAAVNSVFPLFIALQFNHRKRQIKLCSALMVTLIGQIGLGFYRIEAVQNDVLEPLASFEHAYQPGYFFPLASILLVILARRAIWKDEQLVRSADRLR